MAGPIDDPPRSALTAALAATGSHLWDGKTGYGVLAAMVLSLWPVVFPNQAPPSQESVQQVLQDAQKVYEDVRAIQAKIEAAHKEVPAVQPARVPPPEVAAPVPVVPDPPIPFKFKGP